MTLRSDAIEAMANGIYDMPYDTVELRNWGEESVPDAPAVLAAAALDALLDLLTERADASPGAAGFEAWQVADLLAVLREGDQ